MDEIHERSIDSDFLLIVLRDLLQQRPMLKLVLMSATLNAELFASYFGNCPTLHIEGFTHPVTEFYLEDCLEMTGHVVEPGSDYAKEDCLLGDVMGGAGDFSRGSTRSSGGKKGGFKAADTVGAMKEQVKAHEEMERLYELYDGYSEGTINSLAIVDEEVVNNDLIEAIVTMIVDPTNGYPPGGVLVFVPGLMEITNLLEQLSSARDRLPPDKVRCFPLHSTLSTAEQQRVFASVPQGVRKVVISTNIAETSVTIDDIVYVIDTGRQKENRFDPVNRMPQLMECWVSKANARQRCDEQGSVYALNNALCKLLWLLFCSYTR
eukprot:SAG31_NODE_1036_length_10221_cov_170.602326_10_plen_321_part_00